MILSAESEEWESTSGIDILLFKIALAHGENHNPLN